MPLKIPYYEMDIPRLVTALADWLACLLYLRFLPPRYGGVKRAALYGGALAALALYLVATDGFDGWRFNVLYAVSVALMLLFMAAATRADRWQVGYFCTRAFILAGFAGALTWQMYVYFARYIAALQSLPALVLFIAAGFGIIFGLMWLLEDGGSTGSIQFDIRPRTTCIAAVFCGKCMHGCARLTGAFGVAGEVGLDGIFDRANFNSALLAARCKCMRNLFTNPSAPTVDCGVAQVDAVTDLCHLVAGLGRTFDWYAHLIQPGFATKTARIGSQCTA